ncbi:MAG TPA: PilT/PilU family type 4a pilus ATPase [Armatimonadota bacterium]|nr:PilT/PilU family type 4a pilus ATPase [Armatimonadota bacterium]
MSLQFAQPISAAPREAMLKILQEAADTDTSDVYIKAGAPPMFRIDGVTANRSTENLSPDECRALAESIMEPEQREDFRKTREQNFSLSAPSAGRFRVNALIQRGFVGMVIRRIKTDIPELEKLGLPPRVSEMALLKNGLVLVVGSTGSGKSTTLAAMIGYRNRMQGGHILTVEDPVEFVHSDQKSIVNQREVGTDTASFAAALKNALRQAPDVILIGEMRDQESVEAALTFAETGHLVFSTLHSTNAPQTVERLLQFFNPEEQARIYPVLANNLRGIVAQRLVPRAEGPGRCAAIEFMVVTPLIRDYLRRRETSLLRKAIAAGKTEGMQTFDQSLYDLYQSGAISQETAISYADSANDIRLRLRGLSS